MYIFLFLFILLLLLTSIYCEGQNESRFKKIILNQKDRDILSSLQKILTYKEYNTYEIIKLSRLLKFNFDYNNKTSEGGIKPKGIFFYNFKNTNYILEDLQKFTQNLTYDSTKKIYKKNININHTIINVNNKENIKTNLIGISEEFFMKIFLNEFKNKKYFTELIDYIKKINNNPEEKLYIQIITYETDNGITHHIDDFLSDNYSSLFTFNCWNDIYYDMINIFSPKLESTRILIKAGDIVKFTDESRDKWTHGIPNNHKNLKGRFAIAFRFVK